MKTNENNKKLNFEKLTPTLCENIDSYKESLDFIFNEDELLNIALTGSYGAGKSSVIKTYEEIIGQKFIHVSLANFENVEETINYEESNYTLEKKLINQFVHKININDIPQTRFNLKKEVSKKEIIKHTILASVFSIVLFYVFNYDKWVVKYKNSQYSNIKDFFKFTTLGSSYLIGLTIIMGISIWYLNKIIKIQMYKPILKKIKFQGNEIEIGEQSDESYFDKHLDEILYIFKKSNVKAIIFEDIDRYNNNKIFSKLREINSLVNEKSNYRMKFIYLLRDDIFNSKDRTKFFDFILPIVPVLDSSNSYDQLLKHFENGEISNDFDKTFLERISLYIDEMRILKNIYNEYIVYKSRIQFTELDPNKLLSIIIYKNIFPKDFADLQLNRGFVYNIFNNKEEFIGNLKKNIEKQIKQNIEKIKIIKEEHLNDVDELDTLFLVFEEHNYIVNNKYKNQFNSRLEFIREIKNSAGEVGYYNNNYNYRSYDIKPVLDKMYKNADYISRKKIIESKLNDEMRELEEKNIELNNKKIRLDSLKLKDLISNEYKNNIDELFTMNIDFENNEFSYILESQYYSLIKYIIRNGYINETYFDYLTYFYENSITRTDKIFLRSITDEIAKDPTYKLKNPDIIVSRLKYSDFEKEEVLNFNLVDYLVKNKHEYLNQLLKQIEKNKRVSFVFRYIECAEYSVVLKFIEYLNGSWRELFKEFLLRDKVYSIENNRYLISTFYTLDDEIRKNRIKEMNIDNCITLYISRNKEFLNINEPKSGYIIMALELLKVRFEEIDYKNANEQLFKFVYERNLYEININMINLILKNVYNIPEDDKYCKQNYTLIASKQNEQLFKYVNENINEYMELILRTYSDIKITDSEEVVISILNNKSIDIENRKIYLNKLSTQLTYINNVGQEFWEDLLKLNIIEYNTNNILNYYFNNKVDSNLINFLNKGESDISFDYDTLEGDFGDEEIFNFYQDIMQTNMLFINKYVMILKGFNKYYEEFKFTDIEAEKFDKLIELGIIKMTQSNIEFIRGNYPDSLMIFICRNIKEYIQCLEEDILDKEEIMSLILEPNILEENKLSLLEKYPGNVSLAEYDFLENLKLYIIKNKYDSNDLEYIINNYEKSSELMKKEISKICVLNIDALCCNQYQLSKELLDEVIFNSEENNEYKMELIYQHLDILDIPSIIKYMDHISEDEFVNIFKGNRPKILINDINEKFLIYFLEKKWIKSFKEDKNDSKYYRVIGKNYLEEK